MLDLTDLRKRYGEVVALDGFSAVCDAGEVVGLVGKAAAGKTTALRAVLGLVRLDSGRVRWRGQLPTPEIRRRFGYIPHNMMLYRDKQIIRQLAYFARLHGLDAAEATAAVGTWLSRVGIDERQARRSPATLSYGQQQSVQLALGLVHDPDLVVLDEPFDGMAKDIEDRAVSLLREKADAGAAIVIASHKASRLEQLCDRVVVIEAGRVTTEGSPAELARVAGVDTFVAFYGQVVCQ